MMATLEEKRTYPCEPATDEELTHIITTLAQGADEFCYFFNESTVELPVEKVPWSSVDTLCIIGNGSSLFNTMLKFDDLERGIYINHSGNWLILLCTEESEIQTYLD